MKMEVYIGGLLIEEIPVHFEGTTLYEHRYTQVMGVLNWIHYKYKGSFRLKNNWEIVLIAESKMNKK